MDTGRDWEYGEGTICKGLKFSLKRNLAFWENKLNPSSFVFNVISQGYILPLKSTPPTFQAKNNKSCHEHKKFADGAIRELIEGGLVTEVSERPHCCNPLTVSDKGKLRLVLDLRHVNEFVHAKKFKYEDLRTFAEIAEEGDFFIKFDLKSGYHHVDIHPMHQKFLGFAWQFEEEDRTRFYVFTVLPFGLSPASYVFTKILRPLTKYWRSMDIKVIIYIDDGIAAKSKEALTAWAAKMIIDTLTGAGFQINWEKSQFEPKQEGIWLGIKVNTRTLQFSVPEEKLNKLKTNIDNIANKEECSAKQLAKIAGTLSSMHLALGQIVRFFTRRIYQQIEGRQSWSRTETIAPGTREELQFWSQGLETMNGCSFKPQNTTTTMIFTDASSTGYGGYTVQQLGELICAGTFTNDEVETSSTFRELLAVKYVLQSYGDLLKNQNIQLNSDNMAATRILVVGSSKPHLQNLALDIFQQCIQKSIKLSPEWIPRELNRDADFLSKIRDSDSWGVDETCFKFIQEKYGQFEVDRFADEKNKKVQNFNSKYFCPGTSHVNTFTANWAGKKNWICPPIKDIPRAIRHAKLCKAQGVLIIPCWPSAHWWPIIYPNGINLAPFIKDMLIFDPYYESYGHNTIFNGYQSFKTLALEIDFTTW